MIMALDVPCSRRGHRHVCGRGDRLRRGHPGALAGANTGLTVEWSGRIRRLRDRGRHPCGECRRRGVPAVKRGLGVDWSALRLGSGPATDVPLLLAVMAVGTPRQSLQAFGRLGDLAEGEGLRPGRSPSRCS
jgi:hypothetical protein